MSDQDLKAALQKDIITAMKAREQKTLTTLRGISAAIKQIEIDTRTELDNDAVLGVLQKEIKKRNDTIKFAKDAGRDDIIEQNEAELKLIRKYAGEALSDDKLRELINELVTGGADNIGAVMGALNKSYKGRFDGKAASGIIKELLT